VAARLTWDTRRRPMAWTSTGRERHPTGGWPRQPISRRDLRRAKENYPGCTGLGDHRRRCWMFSRVPPEPSRARVWFGCGGRLPNATLSGPSWLAEPPVRMVLSFPGALCCHLVQIDLPTAKQTRARAAHRRFYLGLANRNYRGRPLPLRPTPRLPMRRAQRCPLRGGKSLWVAGTRDGPVRASCTAPLKRAARGSRAPSDWGSGTRARRRSLFEGREL
jgi:hypothetical protein